MFNDAGIDEAGVDSLKPLDKRNIAAVIVAHTSARIGDSRSTYQDGIISRVNLKAAELSAVPGMLLQSFIKHVLDQNKT